MHGEDVELSDRRPGSEGRSYGLDAQGDRHLRVRGRRVRGAHGGRDQQDARPAHSPQHLRYRPQHRHWGNRGTLLRLLLLFYKL